MRKYRYDFDKEFLARLDTFAINHIDDDRKVFNGVWSEWLSNNSDMIHIEVERLKSEGCDKNIMEKMYHHVRFALRKSLVKNEKKKQKDVVDGVVTGIGVEKKEKLTKEEKKKLMNIIIRHIEDFIKSGFIHNHSPSEAFDDFYHNCIFDNSNIEYTMEYLKKSYKNKYYILVRN